MKTAILGGALALVMIPAMAGAQAIERITDTQVGATILRGVKIPAGAETFMLSGLVALPIDPAKAETVEHYGDTRVQTVSTLNRIRTLLEEQGYAMGDIVKLTVFLVGDQKLEGRLDFAGMNAGFRQFFGTADNPVTVARSTVQVTALTSPKYLVEIDAIAVKVSR